MGPGLAYNAPTLNCIPNVISKVSSMYALTTSAPYVIANSVQSSRVCSVRVQFSSVQRQPCPVEPCLIRPCYPGRVQSSRADRAVSSRAVCPIGPCCSGRVHCPVVWRRCRLSSIRGRRRGTDRPARHSCLFSRQIVLSAPVRRALIAGRPQADRQHIAHARSKLVRTLVLPAFCPFGSLERCMNLKVSWNVI